MEKPTITDKQRTVLYDFYKSMKGLTFDEKANVIKYLSCVLHDDISAFIKQTEGLNNDLKKLLKNIDK